MELIKDNVVKITEDAVKIEKLKALGFVERTASQEPAKASEVEPAKEAKKK